MTAAVKLCVLASGLFLLAGMVLGVVKYHGMMRSAEHRAPAYLDIAHRAALLYSFASLVLAKLAEFSPYSSAATVTAAAVPLFYFALTIIGYANLGWQGREETQFSERTFITTQRAHFYHDLVHVRAHRRRNRRRGRASVGLCKDAIIGITGVQSTNFSWLVPQGRQLKLVL